MSISPFNSHFQFYHKTELFWEPPLWSPSCWCTLWCQHTSSRFSLALRGPQTHSLESVQGPLKSTSKPSFWPKSSAISRAAFSPATLMYRRWARSAISCLHASAHGISYSWKVTFPPPSQPPPVKNHILPSKFSSNTTPSKEPSRSPQPVLTLRCLNQGAAHILPNMAATQMVPFPCCNASSLWGTDGTLHLSHPTHNSAQWVKRNFQYSKY